MVDKYENFGELIASEPVEAYNIEFIQRGSNIALIAPHAGKIELGTSEITKSIAQDDLTYYLFEGRKRKNNSNLHITSSNFDEPTAIEIARSAHLVVTIHGQASNEIFVNVGGLAFELGEQVITALNNNHFNASRHLGKLTGTDKSNICNLGQSGEGIQLEVSGALRVRLRSDPLQMAQFITAIRSALSLC